MQNILGISLGTRLLGIAVVYDGELSNFRVHSFGGSWTEQKRRGISFSLQKVIRKYAAAHIIVKIPPSTHCSQSIYNLLFDLREYAMQHGIPLKVCTIATMKTVYAGKNKQVIIQAIASKYPNHAILSKLLHTQRKRGMVYHVKLFEAIACTELAQRILQ
ncbi:hypothetical protein CJD36_009185 [Flavipsychrobacter stenotrophus]|uniref:Holliday junction resolvase RuvC n=1 Tax=Flavipsychrobacter stenotrophus TaxID=2077091 RepID=A0A2S7SZF7_9BACT|nr:hypothetical protein [Flavipsychrobacter stenotrophus]PQJ11955.1 hypothetical protein CJD36_009185 [Flavipsychrobacter stenotrophus]